MKILMLCSYNFKDNPTGAGTQIRETCNYLRGIGVSVTRIYLRLPMFHFECEDGAALSPLEFRELCSNFDVVHLIHCSREMAAAWRSLRINKPVVGSTIFWGGWSRICIAFKTYPVGMSLAKMVSTFFLDMFRLRNNFKGIDVFLPNSNAEGSVVDKYYNRDKHSVIFPVPNGLVLPDSNMLKLPRDNQVPSGDYIVVPGIFANRKNQIGLIKALRKTDYNVVFLGGFCNQNSALTWFKDKCLSLASEKMIFLGHIPSSSDRYWRILSHARCACLASDCETPSIAMIEAAYAGARPCITKFGGTEEYFGFDGEFFDPRDVGAIRASVDRAWHRGRLTEGQSSAYSRFSWKYCAEVTVQAYELAKKVREGGK